MIASPITGWRALARRRASAFSIAFLVLVALACFGAPLLTLAFDLDPYRMHLARLYAPPSTEHWLGTDELGRDVLARLIYGGRVSLTVAIGAGFVSTVIGGAIGIYAGLKGGVADALLMRFTEAMIAVPKLPLLMLLAATDLTKLFPDWESARGSAASVLKLMAVIAVFGWMSSARLARATTLSIRERDFVTASRGFGASTAHIVRAHVVPHALPVLIVAATVEIGEIVVYESVLSFLGLGIQPPVPSWGAMLSKGMTELHRAPLIVVLPGLATTLVVAAFHVLGDGLRDALDPRLRSEAASRLGSPKPRPALAPPRQGG